MRAEALPAPPRPQSRRGVALMLLAMALVPMIDVFAKQLALQGLSALQIIFMRMAYGTVLMLPLMLWAHRGGGGGRGRRASPLVSFLLGLTSLGAGVFFCRAVLAVDRRYAGDHLVQPLFVTLMSRYLLKERVGALRWAALAVGLIATLVIIRPGSGAFEPASLLALASGACMAAYAIIVRSGAGRYSALSVTFLTHAVAGLIALPLMVMVWQAPTAGQWLNGLNMALVGLAGQYLIIRAYDHCEASLLAPLSYTEIVTSTLVSWWFFHQVPDALTFAGVAVLIGSAIAVARSG
ncbi:MAG: DMT family transporter [Paracoccaceae bacterium]